MKLQKETLDITALERKYDKENNHIVCTCVDKSGFLYEARWADSEDAATQYSVEEMDNPVSLERVSMPKAGVFAREYDPANAMISEFHHDDELVITALKSDLARFWPDSVMNNAELIFRDNINVPELFDFKNDRKGLIIMPTATMDINKAKAEFKTVALSTDGREYLLVWDLNEDVVRDQNGMVKPSGIFGKTGIGQYKQAMDKDGFEVNQEYWGERNLFRQLVAQKLQEKRDKHRFKVPTAALNVTKTAGKGVER